MSTIRLSCAFALILFSINPASAQIKMGLAGPMTGEQATFGAQMKTGAEVAVDDINAHGGLLGQKIELNIGDDRADPKEGLLVANKFITGGVTFVVGHLESSPSIAASKEYAESNVFMITPGATNPELTDANLWNTHRICGRDDQQGKVAGDYIAAHLVGKKIAVLHDRSPYGKGLADETKKAMNAAGMTEAFYDGVDVSGKDYSAVISRLKEMNIDYLYFGGLHTPAGLMLRQMRDQGLSTKLISGDAIVTPELASIAGDAVIGTMMTFGHDPLKNPSAAKIIAEFRARKLNPETYSIYSYAAFQVIAQAIEAANSVDPKKVAELVRSGRTFNTVLGDLSFDKKGDLSKSDYVMYEWVKDANGQIKYQEKAAKAASN